MVNLTGKMIDLAEDEDSGKYRITFELEEVPSSLDVFNGLLQAEKLSIEVKKYRQKRSLEANGYCWYLCTELAKKMSDDKARYTKEDVYRNAIREIGIYRDFEHLSEQEAKTLTVAWGMLGTGWIAEQVDYEQDGDTVRLRCYYGSSQYNTKQMSRLIDHLVQDALAVGDIDVLSEKERQRMIEEWDKAYKLYREHQKG